VTRAATFPLPGIARVGALRTVLLLGTLAILVAYFSWQSPFFLTVPNILNVASELPEIGLLVVGLTFVIITGAMDLSVGSVVGLSAAVLASLSHAGLNIWLCVVAALLTGAACGSLNGLFVARFRMQAVVVTVGTLVLFRGAIFVLTGGRPQSGLPEVFYFLGQGAVFGVPFNFLILLVVAVCAHFVLTRTVYGRRVFALGNNEEALRYSGAPIVATRFTVFVVSGVLAAAAGILLASRLASTQANTGQGFELEAITAVLMGGVHIFGGRGSIVGAFIGLVTIVVLRNGLNVMGVSSVIETLILGILILVAVGAGSQNRRS
jgi:ribose transport system permease protein